MSGFHHRLPSLPPWFCDAFPNHTCRDLDYSGYYKPEFNYCFIMHSFMENIQKLLCKKVDTGG